MEATPFAEGDVELEDTLQSVGSKKGVNPIGVHVELVPLELEIPFSGGTTVSKMATEAIHGNHPNGGRGDFTSPLLDLDPVPNGHDVLLLVLLGIIR